MDDNALAALKAAYEASRPGKWEMIKRGGLYNIDTPDIDDYAIADNCLEADAAFIVAAHEYVPALLAEVEKLRAALNEIMHETPYGSAAYIAAYNALNPDTPMPTDAP